MTSKTSLETVKLAIMKARYSIAYPFMIHEGSAKVKKNTHHQHRPPSNQRPSLAVTQLIRVYQKKHAFVYSQLEV